MERESFKEIVIMMLIALAIIFGLGTIMCNSDVVIVSNETLDNEINYVCSKTPTPMGCDCSRYRERLCVKWRIQVPEGSIDDFTDEVGLRPWEN